MSVEKNLTDSTDDPKLFSKLYQYTLGLLARREYSRSELAQKLAAKTDDVSVIETLLARVIELNYQSDERFTEAFVRHKVFRGKGPAVIRLELKQKGISAELIDQALRGDEYDWYALALEGYQRKFRHKPIDSPKERARRQRFLYSRGFDSDIVRYVMEADQEN